MNTSNEISCQVQRANILNLDKIIRQVSANDPILKKLRSDQLIVAYDRKKGKAHIHNSAFSISSFLGTGSASELYLLDTYERIEIAQKCKLNSTYAKSLDIEIRSILLVMKGAELKLVEALARRDTPVKLLADFLFRWIAAELSASADIAYNDHTRFKEKIRIAIEEEGKKIGLTLKARVTYLLPVSNLPSTLSLEINEKQLRIQPIRYNGFVFLDFELVLVPDDSLSSNITTELTLRNKDEFRELLKSMTQSFIRKSVSYNQLVYELHGSVRKNLIQYWNENLQQLNKGWKIADLKLSSSENPPIHYKREELEIKVLLKNAEIALRNKVALYLEDAQVFKNNSINNLDEWIKDKLQKVTQKVLASVLYAEFVSMFEQYSEAIKKELDDEIKITGYKVELLLTSEPIGPDKLQIDFQLNEDEQLFETILNDKIRLNTFVSGKILNLKHETWNKTLSPTTDLTKEIKTEILREIRNKILQVTPDNFYSKFNIEIPEQIKAMVKSVLISKYNLKSDVDVHIKIEHSQLKERLDELSRGSLYAKAALFNNAATFTIKFCIIGVPFDKWGLFANKKYKDIEEEQNSIKEDITFYVEKRLNQTVTEKTAGNKYLVDLVQSFAEEAVIDIRSNRFLNIYIEKVTQESNEIRDILVGENMIYIKETIMRLQLRRKQIAGEIENAQKTEHVKLVKELEAELHEIDKTLNPDNSRHEMDQLKLDNSRTGITNDKKDNQ